MFYCVDGEKALISEDNSQERELHRLVVKTHSRPFWNVFFPLIYAYCSNYFMYNVFFIERLI